MKRVLIASPVRQKPAILREFLAGLEGLETEGLEVNYVFTPDNDPLLDEFEFESNKLLKDSIDRHHGVFIYPLDAWPYHHEKYICDEDNHYWTNDLVQKVAAYKNAFIADAIKDNYDYLFLVDSDIVLQPKTLTHLVGLQKDIVSEVFWTRWPNASLECPQVWLGGDYRLHHLNYPHEPVTQEEVARRTGEFFTMLRRPGTYPVGGLGACTLISRKALEAGVSFAFLPNIDYNGEDRHFCIRAAALGLELWADTHYPPFHIYRESDLVRLPVWRDRQRQRGSRITVGMLVRNEAGRYLREVLEQAKQIADSIVIIDDASTDDTPMICRNSLDVHNCIPDFSNGRFDYTSWNGNHVVLNREHGFENEVALRKLLWDGVTKRGNDWLLILDADELLEPRALSEIRRLAEDLTAEAYSFRRYDMWDESHYREDEHWQAHRWPWVMMVRYIPGYDYQWKEQPLHCGRFPMNATDGLKIVKSDLRIKHMGWARPEDRERRYEWYRKMDPEAKWGIQAQYDSILDPSPNLRPWVDEEKPPTISLCMIVRDEGGNLPRCLESVRGVVDEICVVDTGSTDKTQELAWFEGAKVRFQPWLDDFSIPRNLSLDMATSDWILVLDADEELRDPAALRNLVANAPPDIEGYGIVITSLCGSDDAPEKNQDVILRLFRNRPEYRWEGAIHEQIGDSIVRANPGRVCMAQAPGVEILHRGYLASEVARKAGRNLAMFQAHPPEEGDLLHHYHLGVELLGAGQYNEAVAAFLLGTKGIDTRQNYLPKLIRYLVASLNAAGREKRALELARLGTRLWPEYADLWHQAGELCQFWAGRVKESGHFLRGALETPEQPTLWSSWEGVRGWKTMFLLGVRAENLGRPQEARQWYEAALKEQPTLDMASSALERLDNALDASEMSDWDLLGLYLTALEREGEPAGDIARGDGKVWSGLTVERLGRIIEGREE